MTKKKIMSSELQQKLARRRAMNGELAVNRTSPNSLPVIEAATESVPTASIPLSAAVSVKDLAESGAAAPSSSTGNPSRRTDAVKPAELRSLPSTELQAKLLRRQRLNGEATTAAADSTQKANVDQDDKLRDSTGNLEIPRSSSVDTMDHQAFELDKAHAQDVETSSAAVDGSEDRKLPVDERQEELMNGKFAPPLPASAQAQTGIAENIPGNECVSEGQAVSETPSVSESAGFESPEVPNGSKQHIVDQTISESREAELLTIFEQGGGSIAEEANHETSSTDNIASDDAQVSNGKERNIAEVAQGAFSTPLLTAEMPLDSVATEFAVHHVIDGLGPNDGSTLQSIQSNDVVSTDVQMDSSAGVESDTGASCGLLPQVTVMLKTPAHHDKDGSHGDKLALDQNVSNHDLKIDDAVSKATGDQSEVVEGSKEEEEQAAISVGTMDQSELLIAKIPEKLDLGCSKAEETSAYTASAMHKQALNGDVDQAQLSKKMNDDILSDQIDGKDSGDLQNRSSRSAGHHEEDVEESHISKARSPKATSTSGRWYPGKYLIERSIRWSSAPLSPVSSRLSMDTESNRGNSALANPAGNKLEMNNEQAINHYEEFITTAKQSHNSLKRSISPVVDRVTKDEKVKLEDVLLENARLQHEIIQLKQEIERQRMIIEAYQARDADTQARIASSAGEGSSSSLPVGEGQKGQDHSGGFADDMRSTMSAPFSPPTAENASFVAAGAEIGDSGADEEYGHDRRSTATLPRRRLLGNSRNLSTRLKKRLIGLNYYHTALGDATEETEENEDSLFASPEDGSEVSERKSNLLIRPSLMDDSFSELVAEEKLVKETNEENADVASAEALKRLLTLSDSKLHAANDVAAERRNKYHSLPLANQQDLVRSCVHTRAVRIDHHTEAVRPLMMTKLNAHGLLLDAGAQRREHSGPDGAPEDASDPPPAAVADSKLFQDERAADNAVNKVNVPKEEDMTYEEFIRRFAMCIPVVKVTKQFLFTILGPRGDGTPPLKGEKVQYVFYGTNHLVERCQQFFEDTTKQLAAHSAFRGPSEEQMISIRDNLEQYVMHRIAELAIAVVKVDEEDHKLLKRMFLLSFLTPQDLDIKPELFNETLLALATAELRKINAYKTPHDKVACINTHMQTWNHLKSKVKCVTVIFRSLSVARSAQEVLTSTSSVRDRHSTPAGADDFLPLFIWVVLRSNIPGLYSNCEYIQAFLNPMRLMGRSGYCLINLRSAIEFVLYVDATALNMAADDFDRQLAAAEAEYLRIHQ